MCSTAFPEEWIAITRTALTLAVVVHKKSVSHTKMCGRNFMHLCNGWRSDGATDNGSRTWGVRWCHVSTYTARKNSSISSRSFKVASHWNIIHRGKMSGCHTFELLPKFKEKCHALAGSTQNWYKYLNTWHQITQKFSRKMQEDGLRAVLN